jgi:HEAT repeat protein
MKIPFMILAAAALVPATVQSQTLASRVAAVRDGEVRFQYASRPEACGDGDRFIRLRDAIFTGGGESFTVISGNIRSDHRCAHGPAQARVTLTDGRITAVRSAVPAPSTGRGRDLGVVSAAEGGRFFLDLLSKRPDLDDHRLYLAIGLADSISIWKDLIAIAGNASNSESRRARALHWAGWDGEEAAIVPLSRFLLDTTLAMKVRQGAAAGLSRMSDPAATRILVDLVRRPGDAKLRSHVVHLVEDADGSLVTWRAIAADPSADEEVRMATFLVLSNTDDPQDGRLLRSLLPTLPTKRLRERLLHAISERDEAESGEWLLRVAADTSIDSDIRKKAFFSAGQSDVPIRQLTAAYDKLSGRRLREHAIFVISERNESEATDKLIAIAKSDPDKELRKKAMFWMAQRKDARSAAFLKEMLQ